MRVPQTQCNCYGETGRSLMGECLICSVTPSPSSSSPFTILSIQSIATHFPFHLHPIAISYYFPDIFVWNASVRAPYWTPYQALGSSGNVLSFVLGALSNIPVIVLYRLQQVIPFITAPFPSPSPPPSPSPCLFPSPHFLCDHRCNVRILLDEELKRRHWIWCQDWTVSAHIST